MRFLPYVLEHLRWSSVRAGLTAAAMALCIFLFCTLQSVLAQMDTLLAGTSAKRLISRHAIGIMFDMPLSYESQIRSLPGVRRVAAAAWFGGSLPVKKEEEAPEESSFSPFSACCPNMAVEAEPFLAMQPELQLPRGQQRRSSRTCAAA